MSALVWAIFAVTPLHAAELIYVAMSNNAIVTYDVSLGTGAAIAASAATFANTNLSSPYGLAFDASGNLYAANRSNSTISKYDSSGGYLSSITTNVSFPYGLAFDTSGNLYASNLVTGILKFDSSDVYQSSITSNLAAPYGLAFDASGNLYAANNNDRTISKYDSSGNFVLSWSTSSTPRFTAFAPVPEPSTWILGTIATAIATFGYLARRRKAARA